MSPRLVEVALFTRDVDAVADFYERVSASRLRSGRQPDGRLVELT